MSQQNSTRFWVFHLTFVHDCLKFENCIYKNTSRPPSGHGQKFMQTKLKILSTYTLFPKIILVLCADHVISTGHQITNLVSNFECLF